MATYKNYTDFGKRVLTVAKGSQREIAEILGITQQAVSARSRGKVQWSVEDLQKISAHYNVSMLYFFSEGDEEFDRSITKLRTSSEAHQSIVNLIVRLDDEQVETLASMVEAFARSNGIDLTPVKGDPDRNETETEDKDETETEDKGETEEVTEEAI